MSRFNLPAPILPRAPRVHQAEAHTYDCSSERERSRERARSRERPRSRERERSRERARSRERPRFREIGRSRGCTPPYEDSRHLNRERRHFESFRNPTRINSRHDRAEPSDVRRQVTHLWVSATRASLSEISRWYTAFDSRLKQLEGWLRGFENACEEEGQVRIEYRQQASGDHEANDGGSGSTSAVQVAFDDLRGMLETIEHLARCRMSHQDFSQFSGPCYVAPCNHVFEKQAYLRNLDGSRSPKCPICDASLV